MKNRIYAHILLFSLAVTGAAVLVAWAFGGFWAFFIALICVAGGGRLAARRLADKIAGVINGLDTGDGGFDEIAPLVNKIRRQRIDMEGEMAKLREQAHGVGAVIQAMKDSLIIIDKKGVVISGNASAAEIFGSELGGKNMLEFCRNVDLLRGVKTCLLGEGQEVVFESGGRIFEVFLDPVYTGGLCEGATILFHDATEKYDALRQRAEFTANISHELKTPLTIISGLSEMLESGMAQPQDVAQFGGKITFQAKRLIALINDIIRLSEFDEGGHGLDFAPFSPRERAVAVLDALSDAALEKNVTLQLAPGENFEINASERLVEELLFNLVDNGIKYNKPGGNVTVHLSQNDGFCKISVADTGIGIPEAHQERVFERFYRVDASRSSVTGGTGLGLAIVKHITLCHKGRTKIQSTPGAGTVVVCYIADGY